MLAPSHQKTGTPQWRKREAKRLVRDRKIYAYLREMEALAERYHQRAGVPFDPALVYIENAERRKIQNPYPGWIPRLTPFPVTRQRNGQQMPRWEDLSQWMKIQVIPKAYKNQFLTFNIHIHPSLELTWVSRGDDVRKKMMERVRKELDQAMGRGQGIGHPFFFVIEGWSKDTKSRTYLHLHGGAEINEHSDQDKIATAVGRAAGHGIKGFAYIPRAIHKEVFCMEQAAYATYLLKAARRHDDRISDRRLAMSQSMTNTARLVWDMMTRPPEGWQETTWDAR